jgi:hypothetical protein
MAAQAQYTNYLAQRLHHYQIHDLKDTNLWVAFKNDFRNWTEETFTLCSPVPTYMLREVLLHNGVRVATGDNTFCRALFNVLCEKKPTRWTRSELIEYVSYGSINSNDLVYYLRENLPSSLQFKMEPLPVLRLIHYEDRHFTFSRSQSPTLRKTSNDRVNNTVATTIPTPESPTSFTVPEASTTGTHLASAPEVPLEAPNDEEKPSDHDPDPKPNSRPNEEPNGAEKGDRVGNPKTPSAPQESLVLWSPPAIIPIPKATKELGHISEREQSPCDLKRSLPWDTGWTTDSGGKLLIEDTETIKTELELTLGGRTPRDMDRLSYWDTGWMNNSIIRKELTDNRIKKEYLPAVSQTQTPIRTIAGWTNRLLRDIGVPTLKVAVTATRVLFRDLAVPISMDRLMFKVNPDVHNIAQIVAMNAHKVKLKKLIGVPEGPQKKSGPVQAETYRWIEPTKATGNPKSNSQTNRKPAGTEGGSRAENSKAPSVPPGTPTTARVLGVATLATRIQVLLKDTKVPISICRKVLRIDKNVHKTESKKSVRAVENTCEKMRTVTINVSSNLTRNRGKKETHCEKRRKTYRKTKIARATNTQRKEYQTAKIQVSYIRNKGGTHRMGERDNKGDRGRPPEGQGPDRNLNPQRNQNPPRVCKFEWAYKPAANQKNEMEEVTGPSGHDPPEGTESSPATEGVSYDRDKEKTYLRVSRFGNRDGGEPGQELHQEYKIRRAHRPDGGFENKSIKKKNKRNTYLEEWEESRNEKYCGGGPGEPRSRTGLSWALRPASRGNKNKVPPVYRYAMRLAEPQYGWQSRKVIGGAAAQPTIFLAAATNLTNQLADKHHTGKLKFRQCVTNNVSCYSN